MPLINPALKNPRFKEAARLKEVGLNTRLVAVGMRGNIRALELVGKWYVTMDHRIVVNTVGSGLINLVDYGIHPDPVTNRWDDQHFAVKVEGESIRTLQRWLYDRYLIEDGIRLRRLFPELFATEADWRSLLRQP